MKWCVLVTASVGIAALACGLGMGGAQEAPKADARKTAQFTGIVTHLDQQLITLQNLAGKTQSFRVKPDTAFGTKKKPLKADDFKVTDEATVVYEEDSKGDLLAKTIGRAKK